MASLNSFKLVFFVILRVSFFNFQTSDGIMIFTYNLRNCSKDRTTANSTYQANLKFLLSSLTSNAPNKGFYNNTVAGKGAFDTVYGLVMCRGDVASELCGQCVQNATQVLSSECYLAKWAVMMYEECTVRYSNSFFFSIVETKIQNHYKFSGNVSNQASFMPLLRETMSKIADEAAFFGDRYATKEANSAEGTIYSLAQCTQDLSPQDCRTCLADMMAELSDCCEGSMGARSFSPSCSIRYELWLFYQANILGPGELIPATKYPITDTNYSQDPIYLSHNCSSNGSVYDGLQQDLIRTTLLNYLSSNASTSGNNGFYKTDVDAKIFGLFMCRGDMPPRLCGQCVLNATGRISSECRSSTEAIVWYSHCLLRYSNKNFSSKISMSPTYAVLNVTDFNEYESILKFLVWNGIAEVVNRTRDGDEKYSAKSFVLNEYQTVYILAQCTRDLSNRDCGSCLYDIIVGSTIPYRLGSIGGRVLYPSCTMRFELFQFYMNGTQDQAPSPPPTEKKAESQTIILIVVPIIVSMILFSFGWYLLRRKARKSHKIILKENFGHESTSVESLQFDLVIIEAATKNFSHENRIGKGGFGEVYKGVLPDGRHIAVKRLSSGSKQGVAELKNEVLLIAKLQHRNLVAFIGFCIEEQEKILIYEYVPNKSLDYFLFDARSEKLLSWSERHKIIGGIARGILYLHEYSRLKVIHRDLKPSNVLLDENMNPKISDFGLARIVEIDQQQGSTNKIVGTLGYMSPEYVMRGQFSEKSDVFSFGVMVLEIVTGKKNVGSYESHHVIDGLLSLVWRQYRNQTPLCILDPKMKENYSRLEVIRCIQIGLLCVQKNPDDRPTMMTIVSYLSNHLIELPSPQEPAFFLHGEMDPKIVARESSSSSINEMSISNFLAR